MLKSMARALVGIIFGILATAELAVTPSAAQQLRSSIPCQPIVRDSTCCRLGRIEICKQTAVRQGGECVRENHCTMTNRPCYQTGCFRRRP
jgi:hypothetical protein